MALSDMEVPSVSLPIAVDSSVLEKHPLLAQTLGRLKEEYNHDGLPHVLKQEMVEVLIQLLVGGLLSV